MHCFPYCLDCELAVSSPLVLLTPTSQHSHYVAPVSVMVLSKEQQSHHNNKSADEKWGNKFLLTHISSVSLISGIWRDAIARRKRVTGTAVIFSLRAQESLVYRFCSSLCASGQLVSVHGDGVRSWRRDVLPLEKNREIQVTVHRQAVFRNVVYIHTTSLPQHNRQALVLEGNVL